MSRPLDRWRERYSEAVEHNRGNVEVLAGFNANIDVLHSDFHVSEGEPELVPEVRNRQDLQKCLRYCQETGENREVDYRGFRIEGGERREIGGQAAIASNYLSRNDNTVIFYTPFLSGELADEMDEKILYPVEEDGEFLLKNVQDAANSEKCKKNHIFEFRGGKSGRLILSGEMKGFGPYFSRAVEEHLPLVESNVDCSVLSGFHDADGNLEAKMEKAANQVSALDIPVHIEYVHDPDVSEKVLEKIVPEADSLGLDETELEEILKLIGEKKEKPFNFGESFSALKKLLEHFGIDRIHLHTYRYQISVARGEYSKEMERIRDSMLFGELSAIKLADKGEIPGKEEIENFSPEGYEIKGLDTMENFGDYHGLNRFEENGKAEIEGFKVVGIPSLIHPEPVRTVGMGDIISSGAFSSEFKSFDRSNP